MAVEMPKRHLRLLRPVTRGDCVGGQRPCPHSSCAHHLGASSPETCTLDVADYGGVKLEDVGRMLGLTRERIRQIEATALAKIRTHASRRGRAAAVLSEFVDVHAVRARGAAGNVSKHTVQPPTIERYTAADTDEPTRISFFAEPNSARADDLVCASVWSMFARWQNGRGFSCRSRASVAASLVLARRRAAEVGDGLTARLRAVLHAYRAIEATGERPRALAIARRINVTGKNDSDRSANVHQALGALRKRGLIEAKGEATA